MTLYIIHQMQSQRTEHLFRASDGMLIAMVQGEQLRFGENRATSQERFFMDHAAACQYLRSSIPKLVDQVDDARFEERDLESKILAPDMRLAFKQ